MALTDKLTAIADATRAKTGTTNQMTLDEIATAINGISSGGKEMIHSRITMPTGAQSSFTIKDYPRFSSVMDINFPFYLVFGFYIREMGGGTFNKIVKVDTKNLTIQEVAWFGDSGALKYAIDATNITIATKSSSKISFSLTSTPGYIYMIGINK